jgi:hypothetical protein
MIGLAVLGISIAMIALPGPAVIVIPLGWQSWPQNCLGLETVAASRIGFPQQTKSTV